MNPAQNKLYKKVATLIMGVVILVLTTTSVNATAAQVCTVSTNCTVGEFLYDDSYAPDTLATCTLNTKYPDGTSHLVDQSLVSTTDGWYGQTFIAPSTVGYYRSEICCDSGSDHLCIDKSFDVKEAVSNAGTGTNLTTDEISSAVWGYSGRTLTGFNNLVADIWNYATRNITGGTTANVSSTDVDLLKKTTDETRLLLEKLVNKPIITNSLEEIKDIDLGQRIDESKKIANQLNLDILFLTSSIGKTNKNWNTYTDRQILDNLAEARNIIGDESDSSSSNSFFGRVNFLRDTWSFSQTDDLYDQIRTVKDTIGFIQTGIVSYGKTKTLQKEMTSLVSYINLSEKVLILTNKKITEVESLTLSIDKSLVEVNKYLNSWKDNESSTISRSVDSLTKNVLAYNKVPKGALVLESNYKDISSDKRVKNKLLALRGLLFANKKLILYGSKTAMVASWLEEGSVVFKTLITNPSLLISQDVPLKYYLPKEIKKENVIDTDAGAEVKYDAETDQFYVEGSYVLKPGETKTIKVRVEDVWQISGSEIESLFKQAEELSKPLEKTSYFAQGITLKSDIDVSLSRAKDKLSDGITPESKIKAYREAQPEIISAKEKLEKLKEIVSLASSSGSILGFIGGSQAIAVWGIVIAVATVFVFLTLYMKRIMGSTIADIEVSGKLGKSKKTQNHLDRIAIFLAVATISGLISSITVKKLVLPVSANSSQEVLGKSTIDFKTIKIVKLVSLDGVVKLYQFEGLDTVLEIVDNDSNAIEVERGEKKRVKVIYDQKEAWVDIENVLNK